MSTRNAWSTESGNWMNPMNWKLMRLRNLGLWTCVCTVWSLGLSSCGGAAGDSTGIMSDVSGKSVDGAVSGSDDTVEAVTFQRIQEEIFKPSCNFATCHGSPAKHGNGKLGLTADVAYDSLVGVESYLPEARSEGLLRVDPGHPDESFLVIKLELTELHPKYGYQMPQLVNSQIPLESIQMVRDWIAAGAAP